jgi:hypothetical protein
VTARAERVVDDDMPSVSSLTRNGLVPRDSNEL